ncbi:MAG: VirB3 family type IV secretion system protein [Alphaproteobacteria bacterium]|nr:VirB3 family type IV secretion system protein [Alphaproteobacteria bacterium]
MRQKILKALANPPRIFYVPYTLAIINFAICFIAYMVTMVIFLVFTHNIPMLLPLVFIGLLCLLHTILGFYSKKEPQLSQIIISNIKLIKNKIPRRLSI